jgi:endonuclease/exonuclease/phosphatase family metal-dependent hydrolase
LNSPVLNGEIHPPFVAINQMQAEELIAGPADTTLPLIILGDLNSAPNGVPTNSYEKLLDVGFFDSWAEVHPKLPGPTCCQDEDLLNATSALAFRIDHVLTSEGFRTLSAQVLGDETRDKTPSGLWPSNHAGVVAKLNLPSASR